MNPYSGILVTAQFVLIALIASPLDGLRLTSIVSATGWVIIVAAMLLAFSAVVAMRIRNLSVLPEPVRNGELVERGPYKTIRHPMYSSVLLGCGGLTLIHGEWINGAWLLLLVVVLLLKINREESLLAETYPDYRAYIGRSRRLIPGLY
ncbi:MAG: isoprenylcysteine carboxylmethyltransferase family protein [Granulosicoccus sp.]